MGTLLGPKYIPYIPISSRGYSALSEGEFGFQGFTLGSHIEVPRASGVGTVLRLRSKPWALIRILTPETPCLPTYTA